MTNIYKEHLLAKLSSANRWLELVLCDDTPNDADKALAEYVRCYIRLLRHQTGIESWVEDVFQVRCDLVNGVRELDTVFRHINKLTGAEDKLPTEAQALLQFMALSSLDMVKAIQDLEATTPLAEFAEAFALERASYQKMHERFIAEDEAERL
jgi:hypothetical protein